MATTYPPETLNWDSVTNTNGRIASGTSVDSGETKIVITTTPTSGTSYIGSATGGATDTGLTGRTFLSHATGSTPTSLVFKRR